MDAACTMHDKPQCKTSMQLMANLPYSKCYTQCMLIAFICQRHSQAAKAYKSIQN